MGASFQSSAAITKTPEERLNGLKVRLAWLREAASEVHDEITELERQERSLKAVEDGWIRIEDVQDNLISVPAGWVMDEYEYYYRPPKTDVTVEIQPLAVEGEVFDTTDIKFLGEEREPEPIGREPTKSEISKLLPDDAEGFYGDDWKS
jgi:hypothetical protein